MEDTLVGFEVAKLAKEVGFNIYTQKVFVETLEHTLEMGRGGDCTFSYQAPRVLSVGKMGEWDIVHCQAPTQSLLQKWLREVHNIYVDVRHTASLDGKGIQYYTNWGFIINIDKEGKQNVNGGYSEYEDWKTHEQALEHGVMEGLKLIKEKYE